MDTIDRLRSTFRAIGYTGDAVRKLLGENAYQGRARDVPELESEIIAAGA